MLLDRKTHHSIRTKMAIMFIKTILANLVKGVTSILPTWNLSFLQTRLATTPINMVMDWMSPGPHLSNLVTSDKLQIFHYIRLMTTTNTVLKKFSWLHGSNFFFGNLFCALVRPFLWKEKYIIFFFHGTGGQASGWIGQRKDQNYALVKECFAAGYGVLITESEESTLGRDLNGDDKIRWQSFPLNYNTNIEYQRKIWKY